MIPWCGSMPKRDYTFLDKERKRSTEIRIYSKTEQLDIEIMASGAIKYTHYFSKHDKEAAK